MIRNDHSKKGQEAYKSWREKWQDAYRKASFYRSEKNSKAYWDGIAGLDGGSLSGDEHIRLIKDHLLKEKLLDADSSVLDIGCGGGAYEPAFAESCRCMTALDYAPNMVDRCRTYCAGKGIDNVNYVLADYMDDRFEEKYDVVLACLNPSTYNPSAFDKMLSTAARVLVYFSMDTDIETTEPVYCGCNSVRYAEEYLKEIQIPYRKIPYEYSLKTDKGEIRKIRFAYLVIVR